MTTLHEFGGVLGRPLDTFFGLSQLNGHDSWLVCKVALNWLRPKISFPDIACNHQILSGDKMMAEQKQLAHERRPNRPKL